MKRCSWLSLFLLPAVCCAQNLVPNGDFEEYTDLPSAPGEWYKCKHWSSVNDHAEFEFPYGSPDYLHASGTGDAHLPESVFANVHPYSGEACMGMVLWHGDTKEYREYISVKFSRPMKTGVYYRVSFWISNGYGNWYANCSSTHFGLKFSEQSLVQKEHWPVICEPSLEVEEQVWETSWREISFLFLADADHQYVTFGNFFHDEETAHTQQVEEGKATAYYFIDKIEIWPMYATNEINIPDMASKEFENK